MLLGSKDVCGIEPDKFGGADRTKPDSSRDTVARRPDTDPPTYFRDDNPLESPGYQCNKWVNHSSINAGE